MNKNELIKELAAKNETTAKAAKDAVEGIFEIITEELKKGEEVKIPGFGKFETRERAARVGRNPQTGAEIQIAASKAPAFKAGKALKDTVNGK